MRKIKVGLFFHNIQKVVGISKLVWGLTSGFKRLGIPYEENKLAEVNGCLQGGVPNYRSLPINTLMGVNLMVLPSEDPFIWKRYNRFVTCCQWVLDKYRSFPEITGGKPIALWAGGIDTERFVKQLPDIKRDCFIYYKDVTKHVTEVDLCEVQKALTDHGLTHTTLRYGRYAEEEMIHLCKTSRFCVLMVGSESQGIAQMEIMSMDIPLYVLNQTIFKYGTYTRPGCTSVPYFDSRCGEIADGISFNKLDLFLTKLDTGRYNPRSYIEENFTINKCAQVYYNIVTEGVV